MTVDETQAASPPRPRSLAPEELGFAPQPPVAWLSPPQLARTAVQVLLSALFGAYLDKRELQSTLPNRVYDEGAGEAEAWLDFVADVGDGFDSTYSIAYLLGQSSLRVDGVDLPRGRVLLLGGDEVYPTASTQRYEDRMKGPYRAAMPACRPDEPVPDMFALPGNHDWYDGLTAFLRLFVKNGGDNIGAWRNEQARSYFAMQLPHRWWLMAVDTQFSAYIDDPQMHYFLEVKRRLRDGDRVILCLPSPGWVHALEDPGAYDTIDYFIRTVLDVPGVSVKVLLSGDMHHYAHYAGADRHLITCGGGGAYLYPTHVLPETLLVPPQQSIVRKSSPSREYRLAETFPTKAQSRAYASGVFARLPWRNRGFVGLLGFVHVLYMLAVLNLIQHLRGTELRLATVPASVMAVILFLAAVYFALPPTGGRRKRRHLWFGVAHGTVQLALGLAGAEVWNHLPFFHWPYGLSLLAALVIYGLPAGIASAEVVCLYLLVASTARVNVNELFAGQGIDDAKSFLRMRVGPDGLTIYPIAVPLVARRWAAAPDQPAYRPWVVPVTPLEYELAGAVIRIS
ncbi:MAG TPA: metallophosphoesterase [Rugosimonospora sp.]|nr:metallophosphoesterase [Rugosimonospora sp.]